MLCYYAVFPTKNLNQDILIEHSRNIENVDDNENLMTVQAEDIDPEKLIIKSGGRKIGF